MFNNIRDINQGQVCTPDLYTKAGELGSVATHLISSSTLSSMSRSSSAASKPKARAAAAPFTGYLGGDSLPLGVAARLSRPFCGKATSETGEGSTAEGGGGPGGGEVSKLLLGEGERTAPPPPLALPNCVCVAVETRGGAAAEDGPSVLLLPLHEVAEVEVAAAVLLLKDVAVAALEAGLLLLFSPPAP